MDDWNAFIVYIIIVILHTKAERTMEPLHFVFQWKISLE